MKKKSGKATLMKNVIYLKRNNNLSFPKKFQESSEKIDLMLIRKRL